MYFLTLIPCQCRVLVVSETAVCEDWASVPLGQLKKKHCEQMEALVLRLSSSEIRGHDTEEYRYWFSCA